MDEYIRKQDVMKALDGKIIVTGRENVDAVLQYVKDISNKIKSLKPADVMEVKHGEWISECEPHYECSECHHWFHLYQHMNFCPNCGAKMDGHREE